MPRSNAFFIAITLVAFQTAATVQLRAAETDIAKLIKNELLPEQILTACGVLRDETPIMAMLDPGALKLRLPNADSQTFKTRVLLIGGLDGDQASSQAVLKTWRRFYRAPEFKALRGKLALAAVPFANPVRGKRSARKNDVVQQPGSGQSSLSFPPQGKAYGDAQQPAAIYIWRWIGMLAPDAIVVVHADGKTSWIANRQFGFKTAASSPGSFSHAISAKPPLNIGSVLTIEVSVKAAGVDWDSTILNAIAAQDPKRIDSKAHQELARRVSRKPLVVAQQLSKVYGHNLSSVAYIPALALLGRLRVGELDGDKRHLQDVERIVGPYVSEKQQALGKRVSGSTLSGHLIFSELARRGNRADNKKYVALAKAAADLGFDQDGSPKASMPFHNEMSDAVFMGTPILVQTGRLTADTKYYDMANRHLRFMMKLNRRSDGLHQHSPLDKRQTAWGRGNGFVALGLALSLSDLPETSPHRPYMLQAFREHIAAMTKHQDEMGMWHQVVDHPESYRELTVTCMTTFAIKRGIRRGWLDQNTYEPVIQNAWHGISRRISSDGILIDVCTGTGKQRSFRDYLDRPAIFGKDARGGAMALLVATELAEQ